MFDRDGVHLHGLRAGKGQPMLLLHGITDNASYWTRVGRALTERFDVLAIDQRAHGFSDAPASGYRINDYVADAANVIRKAFGGPVLVLGHSFGGWVQLQLAAQHPDLVRALIMEDPPLRADMNGDFDTTSQDKNRWEWFAWLREVQAGGYGAAFARARSEHPTWSDEDCHESAISKLQVRPRLYEADGVEFDRNWQRAAAQVRCPTLLLHGEAALGSIMHADTLPRAQQLMPHIKPVFCAGSGHAPHRENPQAMLVAIDAFVNTLGQ